MTMGGFQTPTLLVGRGRRSDDDDEDARDDQRRG